MTLPALALLFVASSSVADVAAPCPAIQTEWTCQNGAPVVALRTDAARAPDLSYAITARHTGTTLGDRLIRLANGAVSVPLDQAPTAPITLTVAGTDADGPCCLGQHILTAPPANLCDAAVPPPDNLPDNPPDTPTDPPQDAQPDIAVDLVFDDICPLGAVGNACGGTLDLSRVGPTATGAAIPLTLSVQSGDDADLSLTGPVGCFPAGAGALFCQVPDTALGATALGLPVSLTASPAYVARTKTVCATLAAPTDATHQTRLVQTALAALGFDAGPADGQSGPKTQQAVQDFATRYGLRAQSATDPALLGFLGLGPFTDADATNNLACVDVQLTPTPRPQCDPATTVFRDGNCQCRFAQMMTRANGTSCRCIDGTKWVAGAGCIKPKVTGGGPVPDDINDDPPPPAICDAASTVRRGDGCACRYPRMVQVAPTRCQCANGRPPEKGGCP